MNVGGRYFITGGLLRTAIRTVLRNNCGTGWICWGYCWRWTTWCCSSFSPPASPASSPSSPQTGITTIKQIWFGFDALISFLKIYVLYKLLHVHILWNTLLYTCTKSLKKFSFIHRHYVSASSSSSTFSRRRIGRVRALFSSDDRYHFSLSVFLLENRWNLKDMDGHRTDIFVRNKKFANSDRFALKVYCAACKHRHNLKQTKIALNSGLRNVIYNIKVKLWQQHLRF